MAGDQTFDIKIVIYPFQEMRKKKLAPMMAKEIGLKKPKNYEFKDKFSVTSVKMTKKRIIDDATTMFRYDLSILAAQMWEQYVPIEKAKNGQDKLNATKAFIKIVPTLLKKTEKKLQQSFAEFKEDVASGMTDDLSEIKKSKKGLSGDNPEKVADATFEFFQFFEKDFENLKKLKAVETKASGGEKSKATEELKKATDDAFAVLTKRYASAKKTNSNLTNAIVANNKAMKKSQSKELSDAAKAEYKKIAESLVKPTKALIGGIARMNKDVDAALAKIKRQDVSNSTFALVDVATSVTCSAAGDVYEMMENGTKALKKIEQLAKKR